MLGIAGGERIKNSKHFVRVVSRDRETIEEDNMPVGMALTIGLNSVDPKHYSGWEGRLNACEADAIDIADIAKSKKFSTKILLANEATRSHVIEEILKATKSLKTGDIFMMTYSCNGGEVPDLNNPNVTDSYRLDTACLYDSQLIHFELYKLFAKFEKGVRILLFSDSCHSGTVTKVAYYHGTAFARTAGSSPQEVKYKFMPQDVALRTYRQNKEFYERIAKDPEFKDAKVAIRASILWFQGCRENQHAADGDFNGLFTESLLKVWKNGAFKGDFRAFHKSIVMLMPPYQTPNFFRMGVINKKFEAQKPFTI